MPEELCNELLDDVDYVYNYINDVLTRFMKGDDYYGLMFHAV